MTVIPFAPSTTSESEREIVARYVETKDTVAYYRDMMRAGFDLDHIAARLEAIEIDTAASEPGGLNG